LATIYFGVMMYILQAPNFGSRRNPVQFVPDSQTKFVESTEPVLSPAAVSRGCRLGEKAPRFTVADVAQNLTGRLQSGYGKDLDNSHLGGFITNDSATFEYRMWNWALETLALDQSRPSVLDVGCGMGFSTDYFLHESAARNGHVLCIEGSDTAVLASLVPCNVVQHDFTVGPYTPQLTYDIAWSCEMLEHVEAQYMSNYMQAFGQARYVIVTHGAVGQSGYHHVNNKDKHYWIESFASYGFEFQPELTKQAKQLADPSWGETHQCSEWHRSHPQFNPKCARMRKGRDFSHFHEGGLVFLNRNFREQGSRGLGLQKQETIQYPVIDLAMGFAEGYKSKDLESLVRTFRIWNQDARLVLFTNKPDTLESLASSLVHVIDSGALKEWQEHQL